MKYIAPCLVLITLLLVMGSKPLLAQEPKAATALSIIYDWKSRPEILAISPDGNLVAHAGMVYGGGVFVLNLRSGEDKRVIGPQGPWDFGALVFSPDGRKIIFNIIGCGARACTPDLRMVKTDDSDVSEIYLAPSDSPEIQYPPNLYNPLFSSDGKEIVLQVVPRLRSGSKSYVGLLFADAIKQNPKRLIEGTPKFWSSDGNALYYSNKDGVFSRLNLRTMKSIEIENPGEIVGKLPNMDAVFIKSDKSVDIVGLHEIGKSFKQSLGPEIISAAKQIPIKDQDGNSLESIQVIGSKKFVLFYGEHAQLVSWGPVDPQEIERANQQQAHDQERLEHWALEHLSACIRIVDGTLDHYIKSKDGSDLALPALLPHYNFYGRYDANGKLVIEPIVQHIDAPDDPVLTPEELANRNLPTKEEVALIHVRHEALGHSNCEKGTIRILSEAKSTLTPIVVDLLDDNDSVSLKLLARQITWADAAKERQAIVADYKSKLDAAWAKIKQGSDSYKIVEPDQTQMINEADRKYDAMEDQWTDAWKAFETAQ